MSRFRASIVAVVVVAMVGALAAQSHQYRTATNVVPVYATVLDRDGRLVTDLRRDEFEVLDNGRPQVLTTFAAGAQAITVVMLIDRSGSVEEHFPLVTDAAAEFVRQLTPDDKARIGSFSDGIQIDPEDFTADQSALLGILKEKLQPIGSTPLWNAAATGMTALSGQPGRRVLLIFTDGHDAPLSEQPKTSFAQVRVRAEVEEVMVYGIGLVDECAPAPSAAPAASHMNVVPLRDRPWLQRGGGSGGGQGSGGQGGTQGRGGPGRGGRIRIPIPLPLPVPPTRLPPRVPSFPESRISTSCVPEGPDPNLRVLAEVGGGGYFELRRPTDLSATFARVANELRHQYLLAFVTPSRDGILHRIEVRSKRPGTYVRARRSYLAPQ
jgi:VWFA-related protein